MLCSRACFAGSWVLDYLKGTDRNREACQTERHFHQVRETCATNRGLARVSYDQMHRSLVALFSLALTGSALAQWADIQKLGVGGESYVSTDGKGSVYATGHNPSRLYVSKDFGKTFAPGIDLPDSFCDVTSTVGPSGKLYVIYIKPNVAGMQVVTLAPDGRSVEVGGAITGPYDREWIVVHPKTGEIGFDYSDGYIGGPKSKGVFYAASTDDGRSFKTIARIDREPDGSYPVDPYLTIGSSGRIYAAWATSSDYNHIDKYKVATSDDGGKTWANHTDMATTHPGFGDTQERWMLGSITAVGEDTAVMIYEDYLSLSVDGQEIKPLLDFYRVTTDGGKTWSAARTCTAPREIEDSMRSFVKSNGKLALTGTYCQTLPWVGSDPQGRVHLAYVDNRAGTTFLGDKRAGLWQVRYSVMNNPKSGFGPSERVSHDWAAIRPPLDFIGCCSDGANVWISWTENQGKVAGWDFTGDLFIGHKPLK